MQTFIWRNFGFELPDEWELLQYSRSLEKGRCAFADRYRYRLELNWRRVEGPPDTDRMLSDYLTRLAEEGMQNGARDDQGGWAGIVGSMEDETIARFGKHMASEACLVELVFIWPGKRDQELEQRVLESFHEISADSEGFRQWCTFGMELKTPPKAVLQSCKVQAAMAEMTFADKGGRMVARFGRRGLVSDWQRESIDRWLTQWVAGAIRVKTEHHASDGSGHDVYRVQGTQDGKGIRGRRVPCWAEAWLCPNDGRLYSWLSIGQAEDSEGARPLNCCGKVHHASR